MRWTLLPLANLGLEVRHDMHGYYVCTLEEGDLEDEGTHSFGFDGREHYTSEEEAGIAGLGGALALDFAGVDR